jgi:hypothetical protein
MRPLGIGLAVGAALACVVAGIAVAPQVHNAATLLAARNDPATLSDLQLRQNPALNEAALSAEIDQALAAGDSDLAQSFVSLATDNGVFIDGDRVARVNRAIADDSSVSHVAKRFATGFVTGETTDLASISGTVTGDLFVFGDIRDVVREGKHLAYGEDTDRLVFGLASAGIAVTAATYLSDGMALPARAGLSLVKGARKAGRLGSGLVEWTGRAVRDSVDAPLLEQAVLRAPVTRPGATVDAIKAAFRVDKAASLLRLGKDVNRVRTSAGTRAALDTLRISEDPADVSRAARLAEGEGSSTRAIMKILGRGALLLTAGAFNLTMWLFAAVILVFGFLGSIKTAAERLTLAWCARRRVRRLQAAI